MKFLCMVLSLLTVLSATEGIPKASPENPDAGEGKILYSPPAKMIDTSGEMLRQSALLPERTPPRDVNQTLENPHGH